ncbi:MAG: hypothetical protein AAFP91_16390, partial [Pseudomonadota bacterium]
PGDIIDLSAMGLTEADVEIRTISGGTVLKLIEGFGAGEFHVKINLNGFSQEEVLDSVVYAPSSSLSSLALSAMASSGPIEAGASSKTLFDPYEPLKEYDAYGDGGSGVKDASPTVQMPVKEFETETADLITALNTLFEPALPQETTIDIWEMGLGAPDFAPAVSQNTANMSIFRDWTDGAGTEDMLTLPQEWDVS